MLLASARNPSRSLKQMFFFLLLFLFVIIVSMYPMLLCSPDSPPGGAAREPHRGGPRQRRETVSFQSGICSCILYRCTCMYTCLYNAIIDGAILKSSAFQG